MVLSMTIAREQCIVHTIYAKKVMIAFFLHKIWRGPFEEPCRIKDPEMKKFHFCFSHLSKEAEGKKTPFVKVFWVQPRFHVGGSGASFSVHYK